MRRQRIGYVPNEIANEWWVRPGSYYQLNIDPGVQQIRNEKRKQTRLNNFTRYGMFGGLPDGAIGFGQITPYVSHAIEFLRSMGLEVQFNNYTGLIGALINGDVTYSVKKMKAAVNSRYKKLPQWGMIDSWNKLRRNLTRYRNTGQYINSTQDAENYIDDVRAVSNTNLIRGILSGKVRPKTVQEIESAGERMKSALQSRMGIATQRILDAENTISAGGIRDVQPVEEVGWRRWQRGGGLGLTQRFQNIGNVNGNGNSRRSGRSSSGRGGGGGFSGLDEIPMGTSEIIFVPPGLSQRTARLPSNRTESMRTERTDQISSVNTRRIV